MELIGKRDAVLLVLVVWQALVLAGGCSRSKVEVPLRGLGEEFNSLGEASISLPKATWEALKAMHQGVTRFGTGENPTDHYNFRPLELQRNKIWNGKYLAKLGDLGQGKDKVTADIGTGGGYLAFRLAPLSAKVYAQDSRAEAITYTST